MENLMTTESVPSPAAPPAPGRRGADPVLIIALVLAVVAVGCAIFFGITWATAGSNQSLTYSRDRDAALTAGEGAIINFNTMDYRDPQKYFDLWVSSSTGDLNSQVQKDRKDATVLSSLAKAKAVTTAKVLEGAVTELDDHAGKASVIVALDETVTPSGGKPVDKRLRFAGDLLKTGSGWQLSNISVIQVQQTGQ
jgi:Mce-associated membrane protein